MIIYPMRYSAIYASGFHDFATLGVVCLVPLRPLG
jgi:hypothetical protein